jgi:hypothetical protein
MMFDLDEWRARFILEALQTLDEKWRATISSTDDLDVKADYGNDLMQLHILQEGFEQAAVKAFGPGVKEFSREPLLVTTPTRGIS